MPRNTITSISHRSDYIIVLISASSVSTWVHSKYTLIFTFSLCLKSHETNVRAHSCEPCDEICKTVTRQVISGWKDFLCRFTGVVSGSWPQRICAEVSGSWWSANEKTFRLTLLCQRFRTLQVSIRPVQTHRGNTSDYTTWMCNDPVMTPPPVLIRLEVADLMEKLWYNCDFHEMWTNRS